MTLSAAALILVALVIVTAGVTARRVIASVPQSEQRRVTAWLVVSVALMVVLCVWLSPVRSITLTAKENQSALRAAPALEDLPSIGALRALHPAVTTVSIDAPGLSRARFHGAEGVALHLDRTATANAAITSVYAPDDARRGARTVVLATVRRTTSQSPLIAILRDPAGREVDRGDVSPRGDVALSVRPRTEGRLLFTLSLLDADEQTLDQRQVPLEVRPPAALNLIALWGAPSFESRALLGWSRDSGARTWSRAQLGQDAYRTDKTGSWPPGDELSTDHLETADLAVLDGRALSALSETERATLTRFVVDRKIGVVIVPPLPDTLPFGRLAPLNAVPREAGLALAEGAGTLIAIGGHWPTTARSKTTSVLTTLDGQTVARRASGGQIKVVASAVQSSHRFVTAGQPAAHAAYWQTLFDAVLTPPIREDWQRPPVTPRAGMSFVACAPPGIKGPIGWQSAASEYETRPADTPMGQRCAMGVAEAGWVALTPQAQPQAARQWFVPAEEQAVINADWPPAAADWAPMSVRGEPRYPRLWLALIWLGAISGLWWSERRGWSG
ncbi:MAG: hypothetical protein AAF610_07275 [Pseudomonadota bacterium]